MTQLAEPLVGRAEELRALEAGLGHLPGAVELVGEPGIGKTPAARRARAVADDRGCLVLAGSASELERDLPFWVFVDALDDYVARARPPSGERRPGPSSRRFPWAAPGGRGLADERYRTHQAVRALLALLGARRPLVLVLDDLHWADSARSSCSARCCSARPRARCCSRSPSARGRRRRSCSPALARAHRSGTLARRARRAPARGRTDLLGDGAATRETRLYEESGGNPFYLQQLARALGAHR